jgi:tight adherence protein B
VTLVAAWCAGAAVLLLVRPGPRPGSLTAVGRRATRRGRAAWTRALVAAAVAVVAAGSPRLVVLAVVAGSAGVGGSRILRARRDRRLAQTVSARVLETCEQLASDLSAGQPPATALDRAASEWPVLAPAAEAFRVGSDVPAAMRVLAGRPGARDLRLVAAAWQVAHRTGRGLGEAVDRVAEDLRAAAATRRVVEGELASARATARLVAALPVLALLMGSGAGGDPWGFLVGHPVGLGCLAGGLAFGLAGLAWIEAIARDADDVG